MDIIFTVLVRRGKMFSQYEHNSLALKPPIHFQPLLVWLSKVIYLQFAIYTEIKDVYFAEHVI